VPATKPIRQWLSDQITSLASFSAESGRKNRLTTRVEQDEGSSPNHKNAVIGYRKDEVVWLIREAIETGLTPTQIIDNALIKPMDHVGKEFSVGKIFLPEMLLSAMTMKAGLEIVKPLLEDSTSINRGKVLLATVKGDLHDIGKSIVGMMLESAGFEVIDLGVDTDVSRIVEKIMEAKPDLLGLSGLLTTTIPEMANVMKRLTTEGLRDQIKVAVGGSTGYRRLCQQHWC
jgi:5-methyltetrahydrofolate--homocysteine methyltransferase